MSTATVLKSNTLKLVPFVVEMETRKNTISSPVSKAFRIFLFPFIPFLRLLDKVFPITETLIDYFYSLEKRLIENLENYANVLHLMTIEQCDSEYHRFINILEVYERILIEMRDRLQSQSGSHFEQKHYELLIQIVEKMRSIEATLDLLSIPETREVLFKRLNAA
ncbi:hypothetical protein DLM76_17270 [Leptospira yasudae]|uniref:hypothetical protein n=1 Tax=Leptospira yasudae TaxID=2202201 RepID=UPI000E59CF80|nr:hypothetical protein [Leptospira yasudae]RHX91477.1 hypothetical protein DLM76_17270 [Leptospira yasudae]